MSYLLQVCVAPRFTICKYLGGDSPILVVFHTHRHGSSLDACYMTTRGVSDIDSIQATARCPQGRPSSVIVVDPQRKLPVVVVNFFCSRNSIKVQRQQISVMNLQEKKGKKKIYSQLVLISAALARVNKHLWKAERAERER